MSSPIYTAENCTPAYQLDWSYSLFWHALPHDARWFKELQPLCEHDHVRLLQHAFRPPHVSQFLVSTRPDITPLLIVQRLKGRLQHLIRSTAPRAFRRNYSLRSIGSTRRDKLDHYLATQLQRHRPADPRVESRLAKYQLHHPEVDLSQETRTSHAIYWYNLHLVFVNDERWREIRHEILQSLSNMIERVSRAKRHRLSRAAIVPDHMHLTMRCGLEESPEEVALAYMNNLAHACGGKPVFKYSYYAGGFSEYDLGVIPRPE
jgi:REP element-mobilizing transposase RayT